MSAFDDKLNNIAFEAGDDDEPEVLHAGGKEILEFFQKCDGKARPVLVRAEMVIAAFTVEGVFEKVGDNLQMAIQYADGWLKTFHGREHKCDCGACSNEIECGPDNQEVQAFMCVFKHDLDPSIGGLVFPICQQCCEKTDKELYVAVMENLGGTRDDLVFPGDLKSPLETTKEVIVLNHLTQDSVALYESYQADHDLDTYLAGCVKAINEARDRYAKLKQEDAEDPRNAEVDTDTDGTAIPDGNREVAAPHSKEDINLLVG